MHFPLPHSSPQPDENLVLQRCISFLPTYLWNAVCLGLGRPSPHGPTRLPSPGRRNKARKYHRQKMGSRHLKRTLGNRRNSLFFLPPPNNYMLRFPRIFLESLTSVNEGASRASRWPGPSPRNVWGTQDVDLHASERREIDTKEQVFSLLPPTSPMINNVGLLLPLTGISHGFLGSACEA